MGYVKSVGVVVFRKNRIIKYLLLHYELGHWGFVKGMEEKGESWKETAVREAAEETGIKDLKFAEGFKERISYSYRREGDLVRKTVEFYLAETRRKRAKLSFEHTGHKWLKFEDAKKQLTFDNAKDVLERADRFLKKWK